MPKAHTCPTPDAQGTHTGPLPETLAAAVLGGWLFSYERGSFWRPIPGLWRVAIKYTSHDCLSINPNHIRTPQARSPRRWRQRRGTGRALTSTARCAPPPSSLLTSQSPSSALSLSSLELSDTKVHHPYTRALLGTASRFCEVVVLKLRTVPLSA